MKSKVLIWQLPVSDKTGMITMSAKAHMIVAENLELAVQHGMIG